MNLKAIYDEVARLVPRGHLCVQLEVLRYDSEPEIPTVKLSVYDGHEWFYGTPTDGEALKMLRAKHPPVVPAAPDPTTLDTVADVQVPEVKEAQP